MSRLQIVGAAFCTLVCLALPTSVLAQSAIAGTVKDTSGAVLPGVTVEAASPVLIEKAKTVVTDSEGNYKIVDLRPGTYVLSFSLEGFSSVKREGLELPSNFTMTINSELKVGSLQEALTVTGASPVVDERATSRRKCCRAMCSTRCRAPRPFKASDSSSSA